nr:MAG TPA: hypothetical protein [Caudoviricetes sp.]
MPKRRKLFYIASELHEMESPCRFDTIPRKRGGGNK